MTCLIVGCGYLGLRVARRLIDRGETVFGTTRTVERVPTLESFGIRPVLFDVLNSPADPLPEVDRVLYCVGFDRRSGVSMRSVYVDGLRNFLRIFNDSSVNFVYASATSVYGQDGGEWVDEDSPNEPATESGRVCLDAEHVLSGRAVILRYSGLYGPGRVTRSASLLRNEPIVGDPDKFINLIHVGDAAEAAALALDRGFAGRIYLVSDDRPVTRRELYATTARYLGAPGPRFIIPEPGSPEAARESANRRVSNRRVKAELGLILRHPDIASGLPASIDAQSEGAGSM